MTGWRGTASARVPSCGGGREHEFPLTAALDSTTRMSRAWFGSAALCRTVIFGGAPGYQSKPGGSGLQCAVAWARIRAWTSATAGSPARSCCSNGSFW